LPRVERAEAATSAPTDIELFAAAKSGDYAAFEQIVRRYHDRVYRLANGMMKSSAEAEEVVQDTFLNVFRKLDSFRSDSAPGSWIYRIAANSALMRLRTKRRKPLLSIEDVPPGFENGGLKALWPVGDWTRQPEEKLLDKELLRHLEEAIERLPEKYRLVLLLRDVEGLNNEEVAEALGVTLPTVKARLHRSRMFVRGELDDYFKEK
jgi:RNA polymerase sigma-70 factor, ECF subfamily